MQQPAAEQEWLHLAATGKTVAAEAGESRVVMKGTKEQRKDKGEKNRVGAEEAAQSMHCHREAPTRLLGDFLYPCGRDVAV